MKTKILLFCMALGMFFVSTTHSLAAYTKTSTDSSQTIPLQGRYESPGKLGSDIISMAVNITPITAELQGNMLFAHFHTDVGAVQVTITDKWGGIVFIEMVNTDMQPTLTIPLMGLPSGSYIITFSGENVELHGKFQI